MYLLQSGGNKSKMQNNSRGFVAILLLVTLITLSVIGISFYAYKNGQIRPSILTNNDKLTSYISPTPNIPVIDTSNWKTYSNDLYSVKLPEKYNFDDRVMNDPNHMYFSWADKTNSTPTSSVGIDFGYIQSNDPAFNCKNNLECWRLYEPSFSVVGFYEITTNLGDAGQVKGFKSIIDRGVWLLYPMSVNGNLFVIDIQIRTTSDTDKFIPEVYQILSTFRFLDSEPNYSGNCFQDSECGINVCECKADLDKNIPNSKKACARFCEGRPKCINNQCVLVK